MSVVGNGQASVGWTAQYLFAIKLMYEFDLETIDFEVIDDLGFVKDNEYAIVQVKNDFSNKLSIEKVQKELNKITQKAKSKNVEKYQINFAISTTDDTYLDDVINHNYNLGNIKLNFIVVSDLVSNVMELIKGYFNSEFQIFDDFIAYAAAACVSKVVFETYYKKPEEKTKIIIEKKKVDKIIEKMKYSDVISMIFSVEDSILDIVSSIAVNKFSEFEKKFPEYLTYDGYEYSYSKYSSFKDAATSSQLIKSGKFENYERLSYNTYLRKKPKSNDEMEKMWSKLSEEEIFFIPKSLNHTRRVSDEIRRGVLIGAVEENERKW